MFTAYLPEAHGVLDDHFEAWFLTAGTEAEAARIPGGDPLESVAGLGEGQEWLPAPDRTVTAQAGTGQVGSGQPGTGPRTHGNPGAGGRP